MEHQKQPLLSAAGRSESEKWRSYEHMGRSSSSLIPTASKVSVDEIRHAAAAPLLNHPPPPPQPQPLYPNEQVIRYAQGAYYEHPRQDSAANVPRQVLDEVEIRELLIDHVGHRCCWGSRPARTWNIHAVEDCNVYVGTLETFFEERETLIEKQPYLGGEVHGKDKGPGPGVWDLDLGSEFPILFTPHKESRVMIPHSEDVDKCSGCAGKGNIVCPTCNADQEPGFYKENQMSQCPNCYGRGLIAHQDGSDSM